MSILKLGNITAEIICADCSGLLNVITANGIILNHVEFCDGITVRITFSRSDRRNILLIAEKYHAEVKLLGISGYIQTLSNLRRRPVLLTFILSVFLFTCLVPGRIYFISVEGNSNIPDNYILEAATQCGISFGSKRSIVRSEKMKNSLLEKIPQLQWAGINTTGCTAIISVREKTTQESRGDTGNQVSSIVANRDGIIQSCTVLQGNPLCRVGQAVKAGQVLVSGYQDCGIITKTTQAKAEILALTSRELELVSLAPTEIRSTQIARKTTYSLKVGKKLIKFKNYSGNLDARCGKIYMEKYIRLPGGFYLPIAIVTEDEIYYQDIGDISVSESSQWLNDAARIYLKSTMHSGQIISEDIQADGLHLSGRYTCVEMIGEIQYEQTIPKDEGK